MREYCAKTRLESIRRAEIMTKVGMVALNVTSSTRKVRLAKAVVESWVR